MTTLKFKLRHTFIAISSLVLFTASYADGQPLKTQKDKLSYTIGADLGENFKKQGVEIEPKVLLQGLDDALKSNKLLMTNEEREQTIMNFQKEMFKKKTEEFEKLSKENKQKGNDFLSKNKGKKGVVTTQSGLQYLIVKAGEGKQPQNNDMVTVKYTGTLLDGTVFDSTDKAGGKPVTFALNEVIKGWTEALKMMKTGAHWKVFIPPQLAYGERGVGGPIGPNETLIFDIHLISVKANQKSMNKSKSTKK